MITSNAYPVAEFSFGPQPTTILNPIIDFTNLSTGGNSYQWDFDGLGGAITLDASFSFPDTGSYNVQLVVTSVAGCSDSITYPVIIGPELLVYIPTGFTPDGDGLNDYFIPEALKAMDCNFTMVIRSRAEGIVFESKSIDRPWDGKSQKTNLDCPEDNYIWIVNLTNSKGEKEQYTGTILIKR